MANKIQVEVTGKNTSTAALREAEAGFKRMETAARSLGTLFAGGAIAAGLASFVNGLRSVGDAYETLENASKRTGATINQVRVVGQAWKEAGLDAGDATRAMAFLSREIEQGNPLLKQMGVTSFNTYEALLQLSDAVTKSANAGANNAAVMELMSRAGMNALPALKGLRDNVTEIKRELEGMGGLWSDFDTGIGKAADRLNDVTMRRFDALIGRLKLIGAGIAVGIAGGRIVGGFGGPFIPGSLVTPETLPGQRYAQGEIGVSGLTVEAKRGTPRATLPYLGNPGFAQQGLRGTVGSSAGYARLLAAGIGDAVPQGMTTQQEGVAKSMARNQQAIASFASYSEVAFTNLFGRMLAVQTRSQNLIVNLFADLANAIVGAVAQRAGAAVGGWFVDLALSFIPGGGALKGAAKSSLGGGDTYNISLLDTSTLAASAISPTGGLRSAGGRVRIVEAVS